MTLKLRSKVTIKTVVEGVEFSETIEVADTYNMCTRRMKEILPYAEFTSVKGKRLTFSKDLILSIEEVGDVKDFDEDENNE